MMKRVMATLLAAVLIGAVTPVTFAYAQGNDPDVQVVTEEPATETEENAEETTVSADAGESEEVITEEEALSEVAELITGNPDFFSALIGDLDPETLEILMENPKLLGYFLPTLYVTVTENAVNIAFREAVEEEPILTGTVTTNGSNLNVRTGPGIGYDIISSLANGSKVTVIEEKDGWYRIEFPADVAYVCGEYVRLNEVPTTETPEGYAFEITGADMAALISGISDLFEQELQAVPEIHGLTPDGNLTLVDDYGPRTGEGQQFITLVTKAGNYFYLIIDRNENSEETVHFLNMVDERDLFSLMEEDEASALAAQMEAERTAQEQAAQPATPSEVETEPAEPVEKEKPAKNVLPALIALLVLLGGGGAFVFIQMKGKKAQEAERPDPDADYEEDDGEDYDIPEEASEEEEMDASDESEEEYLDDDEVE